MTFPPSSVISAVRFSHSNWSNGFTLASLKVRGTGSDFLVATGAFRDPRLAAETGAGRWGAFAREDDKAGLRVSIMFYLSDRIKC